MQTNSLLLDLWPIGGKVFTMLFTVIYTCMYRDTAVDRFNQIPDSIYFIKVLNATFFKKSGAQTCNVCQFFPATWLSRWFQIRGALLMSSWRRSGGPRCTSSAPTRLP